MIILKRLDIGDLLVEVDGRRLIVAGEPLTLPSGAAVFGVYPVETWRWEDGRRIQPGEVRHPRRALEKAAREAQMPVDLEEVSD